MKSFKKCSSNRLMEKFWLQVGLTMKNAKVAIYKFKLVSISGWMRYICKIVFRNFKKGYIDV